MRSSAHILIVDDELGILESLRKIFEREAYQVSVTDNGQEALAHVQMGRVDGVLADIMMPHMNGVDLLRSVKAMSPATEVVMMTAFGTVDNAVACMRQGACDFITKPFKRARVVQCMRRALERRALLRDNSHLRQTGKDRGHQGQALIGKSLAMRRLLEVVQKAAPSAATLLLIGESGTGKEVLARHIHDLSERAWGPWVAVNCAALPDTLLETELFGHERGAFTGATSRREGRFERAHGGTIFLDEMGETSAAVQVRLLRVLQEGEIERVGGQATVPVDVRVVAATHRNLEEDVRTGRFREDLYYRLNVIPIQLPPLRDRQGDVSLLAHHFLRRLNDKNRKNIQGFSQAALGALEAYPWPGNVRELENTVERAVVLGQGDVVDLGDLPEALTQAWAAQLGQPPDAMQEPCAKEGIFIPFGMPLETVKRHLIHETLKRTQGDKNTTASLLGIAARTVYRNMDPAL